MRNIAMSFHKIHISYTRLNSNWLILLIAVIGIGIFQAIPGPHILDDAYITFRYSRNIDAGLGFVYNLNEPVQGSTTPLYTLLLALIAKFIGPKTIPTISFSIGLIADVLNVWFLFRIARHLLQHDLAAYILSMVFLFSSFRLNLARGGMETSLFITLLLAMYFFYLLNRKVYSSAFLAALLILMRIDGVLAVIPVAVHALFVYKERALKASLIVICILIPWFSWAYWYFGNPLPHSIIAKMAAYQELDARSTLIFLLTFLGTGTVGPYRQVLVILPGLVTAIFLIIFGLKWIRAGHQESMVVITYPFLYYLVMTIRGAPMFFCWYYLPLMPGFLILFFGSLLYITGNLSSYQRFWFPNSVLFFSGTIFIAIPALLMHIQPGWGISRDVENLYKQTSVEIANQVKDGSLILAPDIGTIGWYLDKAHILDPVGLVSPISLQYLNRGGVSLFRWK